MAPTLVDATPFASSGSVTSSNQTIPASATAGRLIVLVMTAAAAAGVTLTTPTGFTVGPTAGYGTTNRIGLFWKAAVAGDAGSSLTIANSVAAQQNGYFCVYQAVATAAPYAIAGTAASTTMSQSTAPVPTVTTTVNDSKMFGYCAFHSATAITVSNYGGMTNVNSTYANGALRPASDETIPVAGATGSRTITVSGAAVPIAWLSIAINPGTGGTGGGGAATSLIYTPNLVTRTLMRR